MLPIIAAVCITLAGGPQYKSHWPNGYYPWLFPHGGAQNGYADYLRAADYYRAHTPPGMQRTTYNTPYDNVAPWVALINLNEPALKLIEAGNLKSISDPRTVYDEATLYPEYADFKALEKILAAKTYWLAKNGHSHEATKCLLEGFKFSEKMPPINLTSYLVSIAMGAIECRSAYMSLPYLAPADIGQLSAYVSNRADLRIKLEQALDNSAEHVCKRSKLLIDSRFKALSDDASDFQYFIDDALDNYATDHHIVQPKIDPSKISPASVMADHPDADSQKFKDYILKGRGPLLVSMMAITSASKESLKEYDRKEERFTAEREVLFHKDFAGPESSWRMDNLGPPKEIALWPFYYAYQDIEIQNIPDAAAKHDSQMRLLRLNCVLRLFNRNHGHYPRSLDEIGQPSLTIDPRTEREFEYALTPSGYTLGMYVENSDKPRAY